MRRWIGSIGVVILCGVMLVGCGNGDKVSAEDEPALEPQIQSTEAFGTVVSSESKNITIEIPAKVAKVVANNGQIVQEGDVLFQLDMTEFKETLNELEQALKIKELELENLQSEEGVTNKLEDSASYKLEAEENELARLNKKYNDTKKQYDNGSHPQLVQYWKEREAASTAMTNATQELEDSRNLLEEGIISSKEFSLIETSANRMTLEYEASKVVYANGRMQVEEELAGLLYQIQILRSTIASLEILEGDSALSYDLKVLEVTSARTDYELMKGRLDVPYIKDNGQVICHDTQSIFYDFNLSEGDYISGEQSNKTYSLLSKEAVEIHTEISEDFINEVALGARASITPVADRNKSYSGSVSYISDMAYNIGGDSVVMVHIQVDDDDGLLKPNYSVDVEIFQVE